MDEWVQSGLLFAALNIVSHALKVGGTFVAKIFKAADDELLRQQLSLLFDEVIYCKPPSSREASSEAFVVCRGYRPFEGFHAEQVTAALAGSLDKSTAHPNISFLACGDFSPYDDALSRALGSIDKL
jgi:tRNA (cytidine32/guanosine34-2'-O)-methyltransferase